MPYRENRAREQIGRSRTSIATSRPRPLTSVLPSRSAKFSASITRVNIERGTRSLCSNLRRREGAKRCAEWPPGPRQHSMTNSRSSPWPDDQPTLIGPLNNLRCASKRADMPYRFTTQKLDQFQEPIEPSRAALLTFGRFACMMPRLPEPPDSNYDGS